MYYNEIFTFSGLVNRKVGRDYTDCDTGVITVKPYFFVFFLLPFFLCSAFFLHRQSGHISERPLGGVGGHITGHMSSLCITAAMGQMGILPGPFNLLTFSTKMLDFILYCTLIKSKGIK